MRIAFVVEEFPCLSETFILNQITGLIDLGHEVDIYADKRSNHSKVHADIEKYCLLERTYYMAMPAQRFLRLLKLLSLVLVTCIRRPLALLRLVKLLNYPKRTISIGSLYSVLLQRKSPYDIIQCHFGPNGIKGALLREVGALQGKLVTTFHGIDIADSVQNLLGDRILDAYAHLFTVGDLFLPISERWKQRLVDLGCPKEKIIVHRMGIDCSKFSFNSLSLHEDERVRILSIARLVEKKGIEYGIRAIAELSKTCPDIEYNIVGDGPLREELQQLIQQLNISRSVNLLGWKQQSEVIQMLYDANILLAPSVTSKQGDQEGIPVTLMEAMAMGIPIVSTCHSGIPELVEDNKSGFLVPERDVTALAKKLSYLVEHPEGWSSMGKAGRNFIEEYYNIHKLNKKLVEVFQEV